NTSPRSGWTPPENMPLDEIEREVIVATLRRTGGNVKEAAASLGIDRSTLYDRLRKYGITRGTEKVEA
ncbi:MAG: helix-turn-helix domain-containing protein, partial [Thermoanaerobaculia bacterium]